MAAPWTRLRTRWTPRASSWLSAAGRAAALLSVPAMILIVVSPLLAHPWTLGQRNWDQMNTQRAIVIKTILRYHQFPFWNPWSCGGHAAWSAPESAPVLVSPFLPVYLLAPLPIAIRVEIIGWAVAGAAGAWALARRFTRSRAVAALVVLAFAVDSRWALQVAAGHSWHLLYALMPWALFFFDRSLAPAVEPRRARRDRIWAAGCLALMAYGDGIYPLPHTAFVLVVYACALAHARASWRPLAALAACATTAAGLAAPKLLPLYEQMRRFPRWIKSEEAIWPWDLPRVLTMRIGDYTAVSSWTVGMWHEWGLYLGWPLLVAITVGATASRGERERGLKWAGVAMLAFVVGGFHPLAPWSLLHLLPIFKSQHVPSRWLYPAVLVLACAAASGAERLLGRAGERRRALEAMLGIGALACAVDMGLVAREPMAQSFINPMPAIADVVPPFHIVHRLPPRADYRTNLWDVATLPGVMQNVGTMECVTFVGYHQSRRDMFGRMRGMGAWGADDPEYRGEAYIAEGTGAASIDAWTPNEVVVTARGVRAGDHLVLNQNWDPGWSANGVPAIAWRDAVATRVERDGTQTIRFRYRPRTWGLGLAAFALTAIGLFLGSTKWAAKLAGGFLLVVGGGGCSVERPVPAFDGVEVPSAPPAAASDPARAAAHFPTSHGDLFVTPLEHAGIIMGWNGKSLYFDPQSIAIDNASLPRANAVFVTDVHSDHLDAVALSRLRLPAIAGRANAAAAVVGPPAVAARAAGQVDVVLPNGETREVAGILVTAIPMYNVTRGPAPGLLYHPRGRGDGYLLDFGGTRVYVSGDTDCTPEVRALRHVDVAFLAMDGRTTMSPGEAAACALAFRPRVVIPYHDWGADLGELRRGLAGSGIEVRELSFYPRPERFRKRAIEACAAGHFGRCVEFLDRAEELDPRSDADPRVIRARAQARIGVWRMDDTTGAQ